MFDNENINKIYMPGDFMPDRIPGYIYICNPCEAKVEKIESHPPVESLQAVDGV